MLGHFYTPLLSSESATVTQESSGGGFYEAVYWERERHRQRLKKLKEQEDEESLIQDKLDAEIAHYLHKHERKDLERDLLARLNSIALRYSAQEAMTEQIRKALSDAKRLKSWSALERLARQTEQQLEEEMLLVLLMIND